MVNDQIQKLLNNSFYIQNVNIFITFAESIYNLVYKFIIVELKEENF